jgi:hypothetical protein
MEQKKKYPNPDDFETEDEWFDACMKIRTPVTFSNEPEKKTLTDKQENAELVALREKCRLYFQYRGSSDDQRLDKYEHELAAANKRIKELDDMYLKLSQKYADLYEKRK